MVTQWVREISKLSCWFLRLCLCLCVRSNVLWQLASTPPSPDLVISHYPSSLATSFLMCLCIPLALPHVGSQSGTLGSYLSQSCTISFIVSSRARSETVSAGFYSIHLHIALFFSFPSRLHTTFSLTAYLHMLYITSSYHIFFPKSTEVGPVLTSHVSITADLFVFLLMSVEDIYNIDVSGMCCHSFISHYMFTSSFIYIYKHTFRSKKRVLPQW